MPDTIFLHTRKEALGVEAQSLRYFLTPLHIMYKKDDVVTYGSQGVCKVAAISEKNFDGIIHQYYELVPVYDRKSTFFVPVANNSLTDKMHSVLTAEDVKSLIKSIPGENPAWIEDESVRKTKYKEILDSGDRRALVRALKALHRYRAFRHEEGKKIHVCDEHFIKDAERVLYDEFAFVLNIERNRVVEYISSFIGTAEPV